VWQTNFTNILAPVSLHIFLLLLGCCKNPVAPERIWKWGHCGPAQTWGKPIRREAPEIFFVVPLHFFGSKSTITPFSERFRNGQYSLVSFLFAGLLLTVPPVQKWRGHVPPCRMESARHCKGPNFTSFCYIQYIKKKTFHSHQLRAHVLQHPCSNPFNVALSLGWLLKQNSR